MDFHNDFFSSLMIGRTRLRLNTAAANPQFYRRLMRWANGSTPFFDATHLSLNRYAGA
jgi:hypothetical protein